MGFFGKSNKDAMKDGYLLGLEHGLSDGYVRGRSANGEEPTGEERDEFDTEAKSIAEVRTRELFMTASEAEEYADRLGEKAERARDKNDVAAAARAFRMASEKHEIHDRRAASHMSNLAARYWRMAAPLWGDESLLDLAAEAELRAKVLATIPRRRD